jgi:hypothetical protein
MRAVPFPIWEQLNLTLRLAPGKHRTNNMFPDYFLHSLPRDSEEKILQRLQAAYPGSRWRMTTSTGSFGFVQGARRIYIGTDFDYSPSDIHILVGDTATNEERTEAKRRSFSHMYMVCRHVDPDTVMEMFTTAADQMRHKEAAKQLQTLQLAFGKKERGKLLGSPNLGAEKTEGLLSLPANVHTHIGSYLTPTAARGITRSNYQGKMNDLRRLYMGETTQRKTRRRTRI